MNVFKSGIFRAIFRTSNIPAFIAFLVMIAGGLFAEYQNSSAFIQKQRSELASQLAEVRARVEGNINANLQLARGLVAAIATEPDMDQTRFAALASNMWQGTNQLRSIAAAPDLVITMTYPLEGNEAVIGMDYRKQERQRDAVLAVVRSKKLGVAGPVDLVQGGQGFVGRIPVFVQGPAGKDVLWGLVSAVIDTHQLYTDSGLNEDRPVEFAIRGRDGSGAQGPLFYGEQTVFDTAPVMATISLPSGSWQIAAIPSGGWQTQPDNFWALRGLGLLATLIVVLPILIASWLYNDRMEYVQKLEQREREFKHISQRFEHALSVSKIGVWEHRTSDGYVHWDARMRALMGVPMDGPLAGDALKRALHEDDRDRVINVIRNAIVEKTPFGTDFKVVLPDGVVRFVRTTGTVVEGNYGDQHVLGINWDITSDVLRNEELQNARHQSELRNADLEEAKQRIEHNSLHDALTGLPNRRYLDELLSGRVAGRPLTDGPLAVLHLDLDRFKQINDTFGHAAGDAMLVHTANVLTESASESDFVARIGGDEFVIVCMQNAEQERLETLANQIVVKMREPVIHSGRTCRFGVSIGIERTNDNSDDPKQMLINADIALYRAKQDGRNGHKFFNQELHKAAINRKRMADEVLIGMETGQFIAYYQPQFHAKTRQIFGVEALARWQHPEHGLQTPDKFLEIAEDLNVMGELDACILDQSLQQLARWKRAGVDIPRVAVNVSARRLHDENLIPALQKLKIEPGTVAFELVESIYLDNHDALVTTNLEQIRALGIELELDDFGTGHTSIVSLMRLRPSRLKIDRQLIVPTVNSAAQRELVRSIVQIGASLGIEALAEGIETERHAEIAEALGCTALQGYTFASPMTGHQVTKFARNRVARETQKQAGAA